MEKETIVAMLGEDVVEILTKLNLYDSLLDGKFLCSNCKEKISETNLMVIVPEDDGQFKFVCDSPGCFESISSLKGKRRD